MGADESELRALYLAAYPRLVATVQVATASGRPDAEEAVQEAFARLVPRWSRVRGYDDPEAWLRRVAVNVAANRRRKMRNGFAALTR